MNGPERPPTACEHAWLLHQPPDPVLAPLVPVCGSCGAIDFHHIEVWATDRLKTATLDGAVTATLAADGHQLRADLLRRQITDLETERDQAADDADRLARDHQRLTTELERLRAQKPHSWLQPDEPTGHVVVQTAADIPASIANHAMTHLQSGVMHHSRLGIHVVVLDQIDPDRNHRKALEAMGDLGITRERLAKAQAEIERLRIVETASIGAHALLDDAEEENTRLRAQVADLTRERDELTEETRRWRAVLQASEAQSALNLAALATTGPHTQGAKHRRLLAEALTRWATQAEMGPHEPGRRRERTRIAEIRREADIT